MCHCIGRPLSQATGAYSHLDLLRNLKKVFPKKMVKKPWLRNHPHRRPKEELLPIGFCLPLVKMPSWTSIPSYFQVIYG